MKVAIGGRTYEQAVLSCPEPGCTGKLQLRPSRHGVFYGCDQWPTTGCPGGVSAHKANGSPMGIPARKDVREARKRAHLVFDVLWKTGFADRTRCYEWMRRVMQLTEDQAHIGNFTVAQCDELIQHVTQYTVSQAKLVTERATKTPLDDETS